MKNTQLKSRERTIKKLLSQYYTTPNLGKELLSLVPSDHIVRSVIDLGAGEGALLIEAEKKYPDAKIYGIDIDHDNIEKIKLQHQSYNVLHGDSTLHSTIEKIKSRSTGFDLVIGNPPFREILANDSIKKEIIEYGLFKSIIHIRSELVFLINGIKILKDGGVLAYILPDGFLTNINFSTIRDFICNNFHILKIMEIPAGTFSGTEAKTHILVIKKAKPKKYVSITKMGKHSREIKINRNDFIQRGDYSFYNQPRSISTESLEKINAQLIRGRLRKSDSNEQILHTTDFKSQYNEFHSLNFKNYSDSRAAKPGDIIIPRVGTRCLGKVGIVKSGSFLISDCLIIIRIDDELLRDRLINSLNSEFGINWIKSTAKGVGAKHITLKDLKSFPII